MKTTVILRNNSIYLTLVLLCPIGLFFAVRYLYLNYYTTTPHWGLVAVWGVVALGLAYLLAYSGQQLRQRRVALRISREGVEDYISMAKPGLIPWKNIKGSALVPYTGADQVVIYVRKAEPMLERLTFLQRKMAQQMIEDIQTPIVINPKLIRYDGKKLVALINKGAKKR